METDWILDKWEDLTKQQTWVLLWLLELSGLDLCVAFKFWEEWGLFEFEGVAMSSKKGNYVTYRLASLPEDHMFNQCRPITYEELIDMLQKEIKSKISKDDTILLDNI